MREYRLSELAEYAQIQLLGDPDIKINSVGSLQTAKQGQITFLADSRYFEWLADTAASAIILKADDNNGSIAVPVLISDNPYLAFARVAALFPTEPIPDAGIDPSATIAASCQLGKQIAIAAGVRIGEGTVLGNRCVVGPNCTIGANCTIGEACKLYANVSIAHDSCLGDRVIIHAGAVIGADGFGITKDDNNQWVKIPQCGRVVLHADVEIGANTTIDRGTLEDTVLEKDVQIDNLVQIAHNVRIGKHTAVAACTGIAGSTKIGKNCLIGGSSGISGHLEICDNVIIVGGSIIPQSITIAGKHGEGNSRILINQKMRKQQHQLIEIRKRLQYLETCLNKQGNKE